MCGFGIANPEYLYLFEISKENIEKEVTKANFITNLLQD